MTLKVTVKKSSAFLDSEELIQEALNEAGRIATERCLKNFDTDGSPIVVARQTLTAKREQVPQKYQTP